MRDFDFDSCDYKMLVTTTHFEGFANAARCLHPHLSINIFRIKIKDRLL
jgi:hypothetical protein